MTFLFSPLWRKTSVNYLEIRIVYEIDRDVKSVLIHYVQHQREVYRNL